MKCYEIVLRVKNLIKNYGSFIVGSIIILYFITLLIFVNISFDKLKKEIKDIIFALKTNGNPIKKRKSIKVELKKKKNKLLSEKNNINNKDDKTNKKFLKKIIKLDQNIFKVKLHLVMRIIQIIS